MSTEKRVLVLETQLDADPTSLRSQKEFMRILGTAYAHRGLEVSTKEVHSRADFLFFLELARRNAYYMVHFVGHGNKTSKDTSIRFSNGESLILSGSDVSVFKDLNVPILIFSCCSVGKDQETIDQLMRRSGAKAVFAYAVTLYDYQAFIIDSMIYHLLFGDVPKAEENMFLDEIGNRVKNAIEELLLYRRGRGGGKKVLAYSIADF
ncbi:MAG: hypothetical protein HY681_01585 [Chloroflexi bacterium]|nr:hypothetical protein [Chloroflexota bacterium]